MEFNCPLELHSSITDIATCIECPHGGGDYRRKEHNCDLPRWWQTSTTRGTCPLWKEKLAVPMSRSTNTCPIASYSVLYRTCWSDCKSSIRRNCRDTKVCVKGQGVGVAVAEFAAERVWKDHSEFNAEVVLSLDPTDRVEIDKRFIIKKGKEGKADEPIKGQTSNILREEHTVKEGSSSERRNYDSIPKPTPKPRPVKVTDRGDSSKDNEGPGTKRERAEPVAEAQSPVKRRGRPRKSPENIILRPAKESTKTRVKRKGVQR